ncbi:hypothetical protein SLA2020_032530 [Shorea laevis]
MKPPSSIHHPPSQTSSVANTNGVAGAGEDIDILVKSEEMTMACLRSGFLRTALRGGSHSSAPPKRGFASSFHHDDARKWPFPNIICLILYEVAFLNLLSDHQFRFCEIWIMLLRLRFELNLRLYPFWSKDFSASLISA